MEARRRSNRLKSNIDDISTLLVKMKNEIIQANREDIKNEMKIVVDKLCALESRIDNIELTLSMLTSKQLIQEEKIAALSKQMADSKTNISEDVQSELLQRVRRMKNIIISGVPEHEEGRVEDRKELDEKYVESLLRTLHVNLNLNGKTSRMGTIKKNSNRLIRVTLPDDAVVSNILQSAKSLRKHDDFKNVFINPDRTPSQQEHFSELRRELKARQQMGENVVIFRGKISEKNALRGFPNQNFQSSFYQSH